MATILAGQFPALGDAAWTTLTPLGTGYTTAATLYPSGRTYNVPGYRKIGGIVYLRGAVRTGTSSLGVALATLPEGYRPENDSVTAGASATGTGSTAAVVRVYPNGEIWLPGAASTTYHLDGISFIPA